MTVSELNNNYEEVENFLKEKTISIWEGHSLSESIHRNWIITNPRLNGVELESDILYVVYCVQDAGNRTIVEWIRELGDKRPLMITQKEYNKDYEPLLENLQEQYLRDPDYSLKQLIYDLLLWVGKITN